MRWKGDVGDKELIWISGDQPSRPSTINCRPAPFPIKTKRIGRLLKWDRRDVDHYLDKLPTIN